MAPNGQTIQNAVDLLEVLRSRAPLHAFALTLLDGQGEAAGGSPQPCGRDGAFPLCGQPCAAAREEARKSAIGTGRPVVFSCPIGLLCFVVPFNFDGEFPHALLGGGVRDRSFPAILPDQEAETNVVLRQKLAHLPAFSHQEVEKAAQAAARLIPSLLDRNVDSLTLEKFSRRLRAVAGISREFELAASIDEVVHQVCETAVVLFDAPRAAIVLSDRDGRHFSLRGSLGFPAPLSATSFTFLEDTLPEGGSRPLSRSALDLLLPDLGEKVAMASPLTFDRQLHGALFLFGIEVTGQDQLLLDLLSERAAAKLARLRREEEMRREETNNKRLLSMISALAVIESCSELHRSLVEMATELLQADFGSLMLLDETGAFLRITASKGMSLPLAQSINVWLGTGIAGKVARSGVPLLVEDIERDSRVMTSNRPRFRTKSFISLPIRPKGETIGVLSLADKKDGNVFREADLNLLSTFVAHGGILLERITMLERASLLQELSVTDPLTGLFNRRFLEKRLEEEMSRSGRHHIRFSLLLVDLDHFKEYNDLCGHIPGDHALKRVAALLRSSARDMDIVTRYGGEEFCIVLPGTTKQEATAVAERIRGAIEREPFPHEGSLPFKHLTASVGIAAFPEDAATPSALIHAADLALYRAKSEGRNRLVLFESAEADRRQEGVSNSALPNALPEGAPP